MLIAVYFTYLAIREDKTEYYITAGTAYVFNLLESFKFSFTWKYIKNQNKLSKTKAMADSLKDMTPKITWEIKNYTLHYVDGEPDETSKKKKPSHTATKDFEFERFVDKTGPVDSLDYLKNHKLTRLK